MKNILCCLMILLTMSSCLLAETINMKTVSGRSYEMEIVDIKGENILIRDSSGSVLQAPITLFDRETLIKVIKELGKVDRVVAKIAPPEKKFGRKNGSDTGKESASDTLKALISNKKAFPPGTYSPGKIPEGIYCYLPAGNSNYYEEEDLNRNIIANEGFDSFGYVYVHGIGNVETNGFLIKQQALNASKYRSAKKLFMATSGLENYSFSGYYHVGSDIPEGRYLIKSVGEGYYSIETGPVGNSDTIANDNFSGTATIKVRNGNYLQLSRAKIQ